MARLCAAHGLVPEGVHVAQVAKELRHAQIAHIEGLGLVLWPVGRARRVWDAVLRVRRNQLRACGRTSDEYG